MSDWLLFVWLFFDLIWSVALIAGASYAVFVRGRSGWWFLLAILLCVNESLYKALRKRYGVPEKE